MESGEKGYITLLLLVLIAFGYLLSGGLMPLVSHTVTDPTGYALVDKPGIPSFQTLQLQTLTFVQGACDPGYLESGEPGILYAAKPGPNEVATNTDSIKLWYTDEHAVALGTGAVSPMVNHPADTVINPNVGDTTQKDSFGFPIFPALFITDVTFDPKNTAGDVQNGGKPIPPSVVYGTWKESKGSDPSPKNDFTLPPGAEAFPSSPSLIHSTGSKVERGYGALIVWNISSLGLAAGHSYRAQFVVHDGDNNQTGGDIGIGCTTIRTFISTL